MNNLPTGTSIQDLHRNEKIEQYDNIRIIVINYYYIHIIHII